jgi:hypothetical protein
MSTKTSTVISIVNLFDPVPVRIGQLKCTAVPVAREEEKPAHHKAARGEPMTTGWLMFVGRMVTGWKPNPD